MSIAKMSLERQLYPAALHSRTPSAFLLLDKPPSADDRAYHGSWCQTMQRPDRMIAKKSQLCVRKVLPSNLSWGLGGAS